MPGFTCPEGGQPGDRVALVRLGCSSFFLLPVDDHLFVFSFFPVAGQQRQSRNLNSGLSSSCFSKFSDRDDNEKSPKQNSCHSADAGTEQARRFTAPAGFLRLGLTDVLGWLNSLLP